MTLRLGPDPDELVVTLFRGASWWTTLVSVDDTEAANPVAYPADASIELRIGTVVAVATIIGSEATIRLSVAQVAQLISEKPTTASLWWIDGADALPWGSGPVYIDG